MLSGADMDARVASTTPALSSYVQYEGTLSITVDNNNNTHYNITNIAGATTAKGSISYPLDVEEITALDGKYVLVTGYYVGVSSNQYYNTMIGSVYVYEAITFDTYEVDVPAEGAEDVINATYHNMEGYEIGEYFDVYFYAEDGVTLATYDWITAELDADNNVHYVVQANDGAARTAYFKVGDGYNFEGGDPLDGGKDAPVAVGVYSDLVTVSQAAYTPAPTGSDYVRISSLDQLTDGSIVVIASRYNADATNYYAMKNTVSGGKAQCEGFVSTTSNGNEILPASIVDNVNNFYWVANLTENGYTFTNANGDVISYNSSSNFNMNGTKMTWDVERSTSGDALVPYYEGFKITNVDTDTRCIAFRNTETGVFGPYSTQNINGDEYNFFLDFFVQNAASGTVTQTIELTAGWNWVSTYIDLNEVDGMALLMEALGDYAITIQAGGETADYFGDGEWVGLEDYVWTNADMIMVEALEDCTITLAGPIVDPSTVEIEIYPGWNWIGFPVATETAIEVAMAGFESEEEDIISSNFGSCDYLGEWIGDFSTLTPGQGYMYNSMSTDPEPKTLVFQTGDSKARRNKPGKFNKK